MKLTSPMFIIYRLTKIPNLKSISQTTNSKITLKFEYTINRRAISALTFFTSYSYISKMATNYLSEIPRTSYQIGFSAAFINFSASHSGWLIKGLWPAFVRSIVPKPNVGLWLDSREFWVKPNDRKMERFLSV